MKVKTSELTGAALDWTVATCEGYSVSISESGEVIIMREGVVDYFDPHRNWGWGGPIIELEGIDVFTEKGVPESWFASVSRYQNGERLYGWRIHKYGPTPLIAAMRCFCASRLGEEVDVPEELV